VKVAQAIQGVSRLFLDTAPVIGLTNDLALKRVRQLPILVLDELEL
jgi:hypothetical protein